MKVLVEMNMSPKWAETLGASVIAALRQLERELQDGVVMSVGPSRIRVRRLPLSGRGTQP